jgi:Rrf2 family protein
MKLSTKSRYGSRAILEIARGSRDNPIKRKTIVDNQNIPDSYLKNILISLKESGIIKAIRGADGGYILARPASDINFLEIIRALEGDFSLVECLSDPSVCERVNVCATREIWDKLLKAQEEVLSKITVKEILDNDKNSTHHNYCI